MLRSLSGAANRSCTIGALFRCEPTWCVFVAEGDRARRQPASLGRRNQQQAEIADGLQEGDRVVLHPAESVREGVRLRGQPNPIIAPMSCERTQLITQVRAIGAIACQAPRDRPTLNVPSAPSGSFDDRNG